jgi:hypothetical protein
MIPTYCISHGREPKLPAHLYDALIHTSPRHDYQALVSVVAHPVIAELAPADGLINICGWRKIMTRAVGPSHRTLPTAQCANVPRTSCEPHPGFEFLVCCHDFFKLGHKNRSILDQWNTAHHLIDLRDGLDLAVEMNLFSAIERRALEAEPALIEGGCSMGVFPGAFVRETFEQVIPFYQEFARRFRSRFMRYDPLQRRCIPYLAERIETHFILKEMRARYGEPLPPELFGCLTASWDGPWEAGTIGVPPMAAVLAHRRAGMRR